MKNISSSPRWLWKGHERLPGGTRSYEKPRSFAPRSGPTRTASHSNWSPFAKCSSFNSSMLTTLESITLIGPPRLRLSPLRCPQKRGRTRALARRRSSVDFPEDDVLGADYRDHVGDHVAARHLIERGEVWESRGAELQTIRLVRAVAADVDAEPALATLGRRVGLAGRRVRYDADADGTLLPDAILGQQRLVLVDVAGKALGEVLDEIEQRSLPVLVHPRDRLRVVDRRGRVLRHRAGQVAVDAAGAVIGRVQPGARHRLVDVHQV